jgi:tripartite-type tricarboxylate transporter receptor subunit TctC
MNKLSPALTCAALAGFIASASAQDWPTRPVTLVVPYAAGGPSDVLARLVAARMSELLGRQLIIENVGGAGGVTGVARVAKAAPDGYQIVLGDNGTFAANQALYKRAPYNSAFDFAPIGLVFTGTRELVVRKDFPANSLPEFVAYAKANQGKLQYGTGGVGSPPYLACLMLNTALGITTTHIPYRGTAPAMQDLIGGRLDYLCEATPTALPQIQEAKVKAVAHLSLIRTSVLPDLATAHEQGLTDFDADNWAGLFAPKGTPGEIIRRLNYALGETLDSSTLRGRFEALGAGLPPGARRSPGYLAKFVLAEIERWAVPIKASGVSMD